MERNINLDIDTILNKDFNVEFKGYSPVEVDSFLDQVVQDYDTYQKTVADMNEQIKMYQNATDRLKARVIELENKINTLEKNNAENESSPAVNNLSQVDILRRIARLEQEVFNRK